MQKASPFSHFSPQTFWTVSKIGSFPFSPPADYFPPTPQSPVEAVAAATSVHVFIHWIRLSRVYRQCTQFTNLKYFQEADCLLKLVKINKQVFAITLISRYLNHTAQLTISAGGGGIIILSVGLGGEETEKIPKISKIRSCFQFYASKPKVNFLRSIG